MRTRPIYHSCDAAIRGHVFCSFLALVLQKELADLYRSHEVSVEWDDLIRDLDGLQEATMEKDGKRVTTRTHVEGQMRRDFQATDIASSRPSVANTPPDPHRQKRSGDTRRCRHNLLIYRLLWNRTVEVGSNSRTMPAARFAPCW